MWSLQSEWSLTLRTEPFHKDIFVILSHWGQFYVTQLIIQCLLWNKTNNILIISWAMSLTQDYGLCKNIRVLLLSSQGCYMQKVVFGCCSLKKHPLEVTATSVSCNNLTSRKCLNILTQNCIKLSWDQAFGMWAYIASLDQKNSRKHLKL